MTKPVLFTRNAKHFRESFRQERTDSKHQDINFVGSLHIDPDGRKKEGFASLIYGNREDVGKLLGTIALNVAADDQAIYELIQNADDCKSSFFSVSYNEKYLLCINNGSYFSDNDMAAIVNVAGNYKEGEDIGTFGIGFKILHRLVGADDGRDAIINNYSGPIIFSWNKSIQFERFINGDPVIISGLGKGRENYDYEKDKENAWLVKILYTCFPSNYKEPIRLGDYVTRDTKFDESELLEMRAFLEKVLDDTNIKGEGRRQLQNGSIFFLKLGDGKSKFLNDGIEKIKSGLSYSFKFLNSLKKIYINGEEILEQKVDFFQKEYKIDSPEFVRINPKNDRRDIKFTLAFYKDYRKAETLRNGIVPNLYTFFSMDEEKNGFNFLLHCNAFDMNNDRRKLQANSQINENLLPLIATAITQYIEKQKDRNRELFLSLYANLLVSSEPKNKPHINNYFFKFLKDYLLANIPTQNGCASNLENVKIKATLLLLQPSDFGCPEVEWFAWQNERWDKIVLDESRNPDKLGLKKWDIIDLVTYAVSKGKTESINNWVKEVNERHFANPNNKDYTYLSFLQEIDKNVLEKDFPTISQLKLFKFSDGNYYSLNEIFDNPDLVLIYGKITRIKQELRYLGFTISYLDISKNLNLIKLISPKMSEEGLFKAIAEKCKVNNLRPEQKHNLIFTIGEFDRVGPEKLKDLELYKDSQGQVRPLRALLRGDLLVPKWLLLFRIHRSEYIPELDKYVVKENEVYRSIIYPNWDFLIKQQLNINEFYDQVTGFYNETPENPTLEKLTCIFTKEGFKKPEEVFFNKNLNTRNYDDLQAAIFKITGKLTPSRLIINFLIDDNSPFKCNKNEEITSLISGNCSLSQNEMLAILEFAKRSKEKLFSVAYIEKQNELFVLAKHSQDVFQYYSSRNEIKGVLSDNPNLKLLPNEFNASDFKELGVLLDKDLHMKVLKINGFSTTLLPVVLLSDKEVHYAYLDQIENFCLSENKIYDKNSFEHKCLRLAIDSYGNDFQMRFAPKILINGKLRIKHLAVKDDITFEGMQLSLASVLPYYKGVSDIITNIINQFTDFTKTELSETVFPIANKRKDEIFSEVVSKFPTLENIQQFAFLLYYSKLVGKNHFGSVSLASLPLIDILDYAFKQKFDELKTFVDVGLQDKIYPVELALENEKVPFEVLNWVEQPFEEKKLDFLSTLGVHIQDSNICAIRSFFQTGQIIDFQGKVFTIPHNSILLTNTLIWLQDTSFKSSEVARLEALKHIYTRINYSPQIPLLFISQVTENEIFYQLEVSAAVKYYFEYSQSEYTQTIFSILQNKGYKILEWSLLSHWQTSIAGVNKIQTASLLDIVALHSNSIEWEDSGYEQWKVNYEYKILIYRGEKLPYKVLFLESEIDTFAEGTSIEKDGVIYVCQSVLHNIRNELAKYVKADDLIKLYQYDNGSSDIVRTLQSRISQLEEVISNLLSGGNTGNWKESNTFFDDFNQVVTEREYNLITGYKAEAYVYEQLQDMGYKKVIWTNQADAETNQKISQSGKTYFINEKGEPYDLEFTDEEGKRCYVQVKATTTTYDRTDDVKMIITKREWSFLQKEECRDVYYMARVFGAREYPTMRFFKMEFKVGT